MPTNDKDNNLQQKFHALQEQYRALLQTIQSAVLTLDERDVITACNDAALKIWGCFVGFSLIGKSIHNTDLMHRCAELAGRLEASKTGGEPMTFQCSTLYGQEPRTLSITIRPVMTQNGTRTGIIINAEDITTQERLRSTVEQLEGTTEQLQSANEELEATNEELQATNEELETTNEELQVLNEDLESHNEELESRTRELATLTNRYAETLKRMPWPVMLVDAEERIHLWNGAAHKFFGISATSVLGERLDRVPVGVSLRDALVQHCRGVLRQNKPATLRHIICEGIGTAGRFDIRLTPIAREEQVLDGVVIMFGAPQASTNGTDAAATGGKKKGTRAAKRKSTRAPRFRE